MFFAAGVSAYGAAMFHLFTHAFFKALLFLGAGSVIHAMSGEQDMRKMGGIVAARSRRPTSLMWIGSLALAASAFPASCFAGFYSKDTILEAAWALGHGGRALRLLARHRRRVPDRVLFLAPAVHDLPRQAARRPRRPWTMCTRSPWVMLVPLFVLAIGAALRRHARLRTSSSATSMAEFWRRARSSCCRRPRFASTPPHACAGLGQAAAAGRRPGRHRARLSDVHPRSRAAARLAPPVPRRSTCSC